MSSKENPLKDLKIKWVRGITASPFPGLSITSSARFFLLFVGQVVWMLHVLQLSSSSWWSGCACWEDVFPKQPALGAACGSQHGSTEPLQVCCVPKHTHCKYSYSSSPLESQNSLFPPPPSFCWHRRGLTLLSWLCGLSSGMEPEETVQVSSPILAVLKHILPRTFSCKTANAKSLG